MTFIYILIQNRQSFCLLALINHDYLFVSFPPQIYEGTAQIQRVIISRELLTKAKQMAM